MRKIGLARPVKLAPVIGVLLVASLTLALGAVAGVATSTSEQANTAGKGPDIKRCDKITDHPKFEWIKYTANRFRGGRNGNGPLPKQRFGCEKAREVLYKWIRKSERGGYTQSNIRKFDLKWDCYRRNLDYPDETLFCNHYFKDGSGLLAPSDARPYEPKVWG
jgi:hypothetical protein